MLVLVVMSLVLIVSKFRDIFFRTSNLETALRHEALVAKLPLRLRAEAGQGYFGCWGHLLALERDLVNERYSVRQSPALCTTCHTAPCQRLHTKSKITRQPAALHRARGNRRERGASASLSPEQETGHLRQGGKGRLVEDDTQRQRRPTAHTSSDP
jgi:hypothetical protein